MINGWPAILANYGSISGVQAWTNLSKVWLTSVTSVELKIPRYPEALRRLEEKKALMEEEANIRQRQLQEE